MSEHHRSHPFRVPLPAWATSVEPGWFDRRVLHHEFWIDAQAAIHRLDDLSRPHLEAIASMLASRCAELYVAELVDVCLDVVVARETGAVAGEQLAHDLGHPTIADLEPTEWLETTALMRAIRRTLRAKG